MYVLIVIFYRVAFDEQQFNKCSVPFMNMLILDKAFRRQGYGAQLVAHWENMMRDWGADSVMTSSLSDEFAQHFYRKLGYCDTGSLLLPGEALEILFIKDL